MSVLPYFALLGVCIAWEAWDRMRNAEALRRAAFDEHADQAIALCDDPNASDFDLWTKELTR